MVSSTKHLAIGALFPTHVGLDGKKGKGEASSVTIPHTRGVGWCSPLVFLKIGPYSPHTWGWMVKSRSCNRKSRLFPTHVGLDGRLLRFNPFWKTIPHTRGVGWEDDNTWSIVCRYSPHTWGWMGDSFRARNREVLFPTHVGLDGKQDGF